MTTGEASPWGPGPSAVPGNPYPASYDGPWRTGPAGPPYWAPPTSWTTLPAVTDEQLRRLPPPLPAPTRLPPVDQRPAVIGLAVTMAVTASLLWVCGLSLFLLVAAAGTRALAPAGEDGVLFHMLDEAVLRMQDGLWVPLYGFPVAAVVTGFCLLARRPWTRLAHTAVGVLSLGWAAWWLRESLLTWLVLVVYIGTAVAVLWAPSVGRWYAGRPGPTLRAGYPVNR